MTSLSLIAFALGLPGMIGAKILITNYYSRKNTKYPVRAAVIAVISNFILNILFVLYLLNTEFKGAHVGLALATSISAYINFILLLKTALKTKILLIDSNIIKILLKSIISSIFMGLFILYFNLNLEVWLNLDLFHRVTNLFMIIISASLVYFIFLYMFKITPGKLKN